MSEMMLCYFHSSDTQIQPFETSRMTSMGCFKQIFIHLIWYHFLYRLEHLFSIIFQLLVASYFSFSLFFCLLRSGYLVFTIICWSTCISWQIKKGTPAEVRERESKKPLNSSKNSFIVAWITDSIPIPSPFNGRFACACNPNCRISFCLSCCQVCFVLSLSLWTASI